MTLSTPIIGGRLSSALGIIGRQARGVPGHADVIAARSTVGRVANVWEVTCTAPTAANVYSISGTLDSDTSITATVSFEAATTSAADLRDGLIAAWNANPITRGLGLATAKGSGTVVVITAATPGVSGDIAVAEVADPTSDLSISEITSGAAAPTYQIGRFVARSSVSLASQVQGETIAALTAAAGPVVTYSLTYGAASTYSSIVFAEDAAGQQVGGGDISWSGGADLPAALAAGVAALEAAFPDAVVAASSPDITVSFPVGYTVSLISSDVSGSGGAEAITGAVTPGSQSQFPLLVTDGQDQSPATTGGTVTTYSGDAAIPCARAGGVWVVEDPGAAVTAGAPVYIETASGANLGRPYTTPTPTRQAHPFARWYARDTVGGVAAIDLSNLA